MPRVKNRDILPTAIKFRLTEFFDPTDGTYKFRDNDGNAVFTINPATGTITFGSPITFDTALTFSGTTTFTGATSLNGTTTFGSLIRGIYPEVYYELVDASYFTGSNSMEYIGPSGTQSVVTQITASEVNTSIFDVYFEVTATGDGGDSCQCELYNITTAAAISGSTVTTVATTSGTPERLRSGIITLTSGTNIYTARYKRTPAGTGFPRCYSARVVFRLKDL